MSPPYLFALRSALIQVLSFFGCQCSVQHPPSASAVLRLPTPLRWSCQGDQSKISLDVPNVVTAFNAVGPQACSTPQTLNIPQALKPFNAASSHLNAMPQALASIPQAISSSSAVPPPFPHAAQLTWSILQSVV
ncbi:hypothetical protein B0H16DRAFT_1566046 [Mycena metata]|uniref:Uncharacterized protein n=1 Tax=Mycena metata TaxID=1033252 RepID=A0AAD7N121_9AGAR|nr:hypothetical protein B0H16DRAFT_1566046 [Mycena metata]